MVSCNVCKGVVNGFSHKTSYVFEGNGSHQSNETILLSCGCVVDFPDFDIDVSTGSCAIKDFTGRVFIQFFDEEMIIEYGEED